MELQKEVEERSIKKHRKGGGWITSPFILGSMLALTLAAGGWGGNLIVYLIKKYNIKSIDAIQINNVTLGSFSLFPIVGAIISDSFFGSFPVVTFFSFVSLMGVTLIMLTASLHSLRPPACWSICVPPSKFQYVVLYVALGLASIGLGGTRFTLATMGADQFDDSKDQAIYFNWYFFFFYLSTALSSTAIFYVQDNVGWALGFGISFASTAIGLIVFVSGKHFYRHIKPQGSPFSSIARVIFAAIKKRRVSSTNNTYNYDANNTSSTPLCMPSDDFRFLNQGALKTESDDTKSRSWSLCTVEEVEDLKTLLRIMPLWSSGILLSTILSMLSNFTILQALMMDRHLGGSSFQIPAGSFVFFNTLATAIFLSMVDRLIFPMYQSLTRRPITPLQQIGAGHILIFVGLAASALIEIQRLHVVKTHHLMDPNMGANTLVPMSAFWLVVPLTIIGIGEGLLLPGQVLLYYQEFPTSLRSTSTAMISLLVGSGFYVCTAVTDLIRKSTGWLKDDINEGRLDKVYWMLIVIGLVNYGYYLICAKMFKHKIDKEVETLEQISSPR